MAINLLKRAVLQNSISDISLTRQELSRPELQKIVGKRLGTVSVSGSCYICLDIDLRNPFYCKDFIMEVSSATPSGHVTFQSQSFLEWRTTEVITESGRLIVDFNRVLPDQAQLINRLKFVYANFDLTPSEIFSCSLLTVDYPVDFDFVEFSMAASSYGNSPVKIYNNSVQQVAQDIRVLPVFSNDYDLDSVFIITESGKDDENKYSIQSGFRIPEDAGWETGTISSYWPTSSGSTPSMTISGSRLTLSGTLISGTWTSPVIYMPDEDYISMYVYGEDLGENSFIEKDFKRVDNLVEVRASDQSPIPNFLISSWTQRLYRGCEHTDVLQLPSNRADDLNYQDTPDQNGDYWVPDGGKVPVGGDPRTGNHFLVPYIMGKSKRMYVKGDGTILAQAPLEADENTMWEYSHRGYSLGIPYKEFGDINGYWNAGQFINLLGWNNPRRDDADTMADSLWHRLSFCSETDSSNWAKGKTASSKLAAMVPLIYHFNPYGLGDGAEILYGDHIGSYTIAMDNHPNEWIVITGFMYPWSYGDKFLCLYYLHIRNYWVVDTIYLGAYGIGEYPCDEGWAICKSASGGFWMHVGYMTRTLNKYDSEGSLLATNRTNYDFNAIRITKDPAGMWAIRNDAVYWYSENESGELTEEFSITNSNFKYLQAGGTDEYNNLWLVDRDGATVYRINFSNRTIDYEKELAYVAGVWPHPRDGSAFLYTSFNANTFSTSVDRIWADDPYGYRETLFSLPEFPISDSSGVQFIGRTLSSYLNPSLNDPIWGPNDSVTLEWQPYSNASLALPRGDYKQFRITLQRSSGAIPSPKLYKIRVPKSLVLSQVDYKGYKELYINPHLRYNKKYGHFTTDLVVWWPH